MKNLILLALALVATSADGATKYVRKGGNDTTGNGSTATPWLTISKAIISISSGDTVLIGDGEYDEGAAGLVFNRTLWVATTTFQSESANASNVVIKATGFNGNTRMEAGGNVYLKWLTFDRGAAGDIANVYVRSITNVTFDACVFHTALTVNNGTALVQLQGSGYVRNISFTNCAFYYDNTNSASSCFAINTYLNTVPATNVMITGCSFQVPNYAIYLQTNVNLTISNNTFNSYYDNIWVKSTSPFSINNNNCTATGNGHTICIGSDSTDANSPVIGGLTNNTMTCIIGHALLIGQCSTNVWAVSNTIYGGNYSVVMKESTNCYLIGNQCLGGTYSVVYNKAARGSVIAFNVMDDYTNSATNGVFQVSQNTTTGDLSYGCNFLTNTIYCRSTNSIAYGWWGTTGDAGFGNVDYNQFWFTNTPTFGRVRTTTGITTMGGVQTAWDGYSGSGFDIHSWIICPVATSSPRTWVNRNWLSGYYIHPNGDDSYAGTFAAPWKTIGKAMRVSLPPGSVVNGNNQIYRELLSVNQDNITIKDVIIDGVRSVTNGWTLISGEVYSNRNIYPYQLFQDGVKMTPQLCTNQADILANLARGEWSSHSVKESNIFELYFRTTDGASPSSHTMTLLSREFDQCPGVVNCVGRTNVTFNNVHVQNIGSNSTNSWGWKIFNSQNIRLSDCSTTNCHMGGWLGNVTGFYATNFNIVNNWRLGFAVGGQQTNVPMNATNLWLVNCNFNGTGNDKVYDEVVYTYSNGDSDGFAPGQFGGHFKGVYVMGCNFISNGPPANVSENRGCGLTTSTLDPWDFEDVVVSNCTFSANHNNQLFLWTNVVNAIVVGNMFKNAGDNLLPGRHVAYFCKGQGSLLFANNLLANNTCSNMASALCIDSTVANSTITVTNNTSFNNGTSAAGGYTYGDVTIKNKASTNFTFTGNTIYRTNGYTDHVAFNRDTPYDLNHITNALAGNFLFDMGFAGNAVSTTGPWKNPTAISLTP